jgi:hypothetical protein
MRNDDGMMTLDGPGVHRRTPDIPYGFLEPLRGNYEVNPSYAQVGTRHTCIRNNSYAWRQEPRSPGAGERNCSYAKRELAVFIISHRHYVEKYQRVITIYVNEC